MFVYMLFPQLSTNAVLAGSFMAMAPIALPSRVAKSLQLVLTLRR